MVKAGRLAPGHYTIPSGTIVDMGPLGVGFFDAWIKVPAVDDKTQQATVCFRRLLGKVSAFNDMGNARRFAIDSPLYSLALFDTRPVGSQAFSQREDSCMTADSIFTAGRILVSIKERSND